MKRRFTIALSWLLAVLCMITIFLLSAQDSESSAELSENFMAPTGWLSRFLSDEKVHNIIRKFAHFLEYAGLALLTYNASFQTRKQNRLSPYIPYLICILYAVSDEIHQYFIPGRACRLFDIGVDALGALTGMIAFFVLVKICMSVKVRREGKNASSTQ